MSTTEKQEIGNYVSGIKRYFDELSIYKYVLKVLLDELIRRCNRCQECEEISEVLTLMRTICKEQGLYSTNDNSLS